MIVTEGTRARRLATDGVVLVAALALPLTLAAGWFAHRGALDELIEVHLIYPAVVYMDVTLVSANSALRGVLRYVMEGKVVVVLLPVAVLGLLRLWQTARRTALVLLCWTSLGFLWSFYRIGSSNTTGLSFCRLWSCWAPWDSTRCLRSGGNTGASHPPLHDLIEQRWRSCCFCCLCSMPPCGPCIAWRIGSRLP